MPERLICSVFRSSKNQDTYLYVEKAAGLSRVPEDLMKHFGKPVFALTLLLAPGRSLALEDPLKVLAGIDENGYYLQMPPFKENLLEKMKKDRPN